MDLTTRCPQCGSTFAASLAQLQLRKGYIRCPNCAHIFDGFDAVVPAAGQPADAAGAAGAPQVVRQRVGRADVDTGAKATAAEPSFTISQRQHGAHAPRAEPSVPRFDAAGDREAAPFDAEPTIGQAGAGQADVEPMTAVSDGAQADGYRVYVEPRVNEPASGREQPDFLEAEPIRYRGAGFYFWSFLSILGAVVLLAQCLYVYRVQLANQVPVLRPVLERACVPLHCRIPYSRDISEIAIMNSSLQTRPSPGGAGEESRQMTLHVTLRNNLDRPQEWPTLILDLLDFSGTVVVKKDLPPASYLSGDVLSRPFGAHTEVVASIPINMNGIKVSGFQLAKFFP